MNKNEIKDIATDVDEIGTETDEILEDTSSIDKKTTLLIILWLIDKLVLLIMFLIFGRFI